MKRKTSKNKTKCYTGEVVCSSSGTSRLLGALDVLKANGITKRDPSWWKTLGSCWFLSENMTVLAELWHEALSGATLEQRKLFMGTKDYNKFEKLPDKLTIYRGFVEREIWGMSYTLNEEMARFFAQRGARFNYEKKLGLAVGWGSVAKFSVQKEHVFAFVNDRDEEEIIVLQENWRKLKVLGAYYAFRMEAEKSRIKQKKKVA